MTRTLFFSSVLGAFLFAATQGWAEDRDARKARLEAAAREYKPEFPAELPFDPTQWDTNETDPVIGDPAAKKGGMFVMAIPEPLPTLRGEGPNSNLTTITDINDLVYEYLFGMHPDTLQFIPGLATHWKIDYESLTCRFRLDADARWADGSEVTADDVLASWEHVAGIYRKGGSQEDEGWSRQDPYAEMLFGKSYERPVIEDKYTISVKMTERNWRLPMYFGGSMRIYPAKYIRVPGEDYLEGYQWDMMMGSGPYELRSADIVENESYTLTRRENYWGEKERYNIGLSNFGKIQFEVVREDVLMFEKIKKGELDWYLVNKAQRWVEECDFEKIQSGWIQKRKIYTYEPQGFSGFCFNMRKPPFDDVRVRRAWAYLFNREKLIEKLFFNEYEPIASYYPSSDYANPENPEVTYNPRRAADLLAEAGWTKRNDDGWLVKEGEEDKPFHVEFEFGSPSFERIWSVVQEDYRAAGIDLELRLVDHNVLQKKVDERNFTIHYMSWSALTFPNPESSWSSELADKTDNNNLGGFKSERVDKLCKEYDECFDDQARRVELIRQIDKITFREYPYALGWYGPFNRILYWNKFGYPKTYFTRIGRAEKDVLTLWWVDPDRERALKDAMASSGELASDEPVVQKPFELGEEDGGEGENGGENGGEKD